MDYYDNYGYNDDERFYCNGYILYEHYDGYEFGDNKVPWVQGEFMLSSEEAIENPYYIKGTSPSPHEFYVKCVRSVDEFLGSL